MFRFMRGIIKWGVIGGLGLVGLVALVGATRVKNALLSVQEHVRSNVDDITDPKIVLSNQMKKLQHDYPQRIAELEIQLKQIERAQKANEKDTRLCREVVALCQGDRRDLTAKIQTIDGSATNTPVIEFRSVEYDRSAALRKDANISEKQQQYAERLKDLTNEAKMLEGERAQIKGQLAKTNQEYADFQMQYGSLVREIDSLDRKKELVKIAESRRGDEADIFTERSSSLQALKDSIEKRKIKLDAKLKGLQTFRTGDEYEERARVALANKASPSAPMSDLR